MKRILNPRWQKERKYIVHEWIKEAQTRKKNRRHTEANNLKKDRLLCSIVSREYGMINNIIGNRVWKIGSEKKIAHKLIQYWIYCWNDPFYRWNPYSSIFRGFESFFRWYRISRTHFAGFKSISYRRVPSLDVWSSLDVCLWYRIDIYFQKSWYCLVLLRRLV